MDSSDALQVIEGSGAGVSSLGGAWLQVTDLEGETKWYSRALRAAPILVDDKIAVFVLANTRLVLQQAPAPGTVGALLETDDIEGESRRLQSLGPGRPVNAWRSTAM
ncbi:hypothetical protein [Ramlibacter albus]|uniref:Uncharacterized protein n=1 Tax=Ramlibacter albus TaxID=2079448 RepID=A0A923MDE8_9BURK|nr:hypothetical protein [Ramlibacter albus]MBC5766997.1 hypothetical protein [Ramlibacter albus]